MTSALLFRMGLIASSAKRASGPGPDPEPEAHRFWQIYISENVSGGGYTAIQELEFHTEFGGTDVTEPGMTCVASNSYFANPPPGAIDNDYTGYTANVWVSDGSDPPCSWSVDLGSPQRIREAALWCQNYNEGPARAPKALTFRWSDDSIDGPWTDVRSLTNIIGWVLTYPKFFTLETNPNVLLKVGFDYGSLRDDSLYSRSVTSPNSTIANSSPILFGSYGDLSSSSARVYTEDSIEDFDYASGAFCVEGTFKFTGSIPDYCYLFQQRYASGLEMFIRFADGGFGELLQFGFNSDGISTIFSTGEAKSVYNDGQAHRFAFVRDEEQNVAFFMDGIKKDIYRVSEGIGTIAKFKFDNSNVHTTTAVYIGSRHDRSSQCYIDEYRITKGDPVYTDDYTPSSTPLHA